MGIVSNLRNKLISSLQESPGWKELFDAVFQIADFYSIFSIYQFMGIPLEITFDSESVSRGYLSDEGNKFEVLLPINFVEISVKSVDSEFPAYLTTETWEGTTLYKKEASLYIHLNEGFSLDDVVLLIESSPTNLDISTHPLIRESSEYLNNPIPASSQPSSVYNFFRECFLRDIPVNLKYLYSSGVGSSNKLYPNFCNLLKVNDVFVSLNDCNLSRGDLVYSQPIGGSLGSVRLTFGAAPGRSGVLNLVLNGVSYSIKIPSAPVADLYNYLIFNSTLFSDWSLSVSSGVLFTRLERSLLSGDFSVSDLDSCCEQVSVSINSIPSVDGNLILQIGSNLRSVAIKTGEPPEVVAGRLASLSLSGWSSSRTDRVVVFKSASAGTQLPSSITDFGTYSYFRFKLRSLGVQDSQLVLYLNGTPISYTFGSEESIASAHASFYMFLLSIPFVGQSWTLTLASDCIEFKRKYTGETMSPQVRDLGVVEVIRLTCSEEQFSESNGEFRLKLDGVDYKYALSPGESNYNLLTRIASDVNIQRSWIIDRDLVNSPNRITFSNKTGGACDAYSVNTGGRRAEFKWEAIPSRWPSPDRGICTIILGDEKYEIKIGWYLGFFVNFSELICLNIKRYLRSNAKFNQNWELPATGNRKVLIRSKLDRYISDVSMTWKETSLFGGHVDFTPIYMDYGEERAFPKMSNGSDAIVLTRVRTGQDLTGFSPVIDNSLIGRQGCNPELVTLVAGVSGCQPSIEVVSPGEDCQYFKYEVESCDKGIVSLIDPNQQIRIGLETPYYSSDYPQDGWVDVEKVNYPISLSSDVLSNQVIVESESSLASSFIEKLLPARASVYISPDIPNEFAPFLIYANHIDNISDDIIVGGSDSDVILGGGDAATGPELLYAPDTFVVDRYSGDAAEDSEFVIDGGDASGQFNHDADAGVSTTS